MFALRRLPTIDRASSSIHLSVSVGGGGLHTSTTQRTMVTLRTHAHAHAHAHAHSRPHTRVFAFNKNQSNFVIGGGTNRSASALHVSSDASSSTGKDVLFTKNDMDVLQSLPEPEKRKLFKEYEKYMDEFDITFHSNISNNNFIDDNDRLDKWMQQQCEMSSSGVIEEEDGEMREKRVCDATINNIREALIHHGIRANQSPAISSDQSTPKSSSSTAGEQQSETKPHLLSVVPLTEEVKSRLRLLNPVTFGLPNSSLADAPLKDEVDVQLRMLNPLSYGVDEQEVSDDSVTADEDVTTFSSARTRTKTKSRDFAVEENNELRQGICGNNSNSWTDANSSNNNENSKNNNNENENCSNNVNDDNSSNENAIDLARKAIENADAELSKAAKAIENASLAATLIEARFADKNKFAGRVFTGKGLAGEEFRGENENQRMSVEKEEKPVTSPLEKEVVGVEEEKEETETAVAEKINVNVNAAVVPEEVGEEYDVERKDESSTTSGCSVFDAFEKNLGEKRSISSEVHIEGSKNDVTFADLHLCDEHRRFIEDYGESMSAEDLALIAKGYQLASSLAMPIDDVSFSVEETALEKSRSLNQREFSTLEAVHSTDWLSGISRGVTVDADVAADDDAGKSGVKSGVYRGRSVKSDEFGISDLELQIQAMRNDNNKKNNES